jgi:hypothetical protein
MIFNLFV